MNIFKFMIHVESKDSTSDIKQCVINSYSEKSKRNADYKKYAQEEWSKIGKDKLKALYSENAIITYSSISRCTYCLVDIDDNDSIDQISFDVIVISNIEDICESLNHVYKDITKKLNRHKIKLIDSKALLFIYENNDIISTEIMIKADIFSFSKFRTREIIRIVLISLIALIALGTSVKSKDNATMNICYSLIASCLFFIVSEVIMKINHRKEIEIKDFSKWVEKHDPLGKKIAVLEDTDALSNPEF